MQLRSILSLALPILLAACDGQADSDYAGEPLLTLQGTIVNELDEPPAGPVDAVLVWNIQGSESGAENFPVRATVTGSFPAAFTLSMYTPPPENALNDLSEGGLVDARVGIATIEAAPHEGEAGEGSSLGIDEGHVIVYVESDMDEDGFWSNFFGGPLAPGFHVMDVFTREDGNAVDAELQAAFEACDAAATTEAEHNACYGYDAKLKIRPSAGGPDTALTVRMAPQEDLAYPDWH
ncbi:hypothetical protein [Sorangium sp. So ce131]|uniref:hypothetical protein n=1 Tax=Sorangium sp. So ce131 TaxID=3133282 RepID=UPI003F63799C